jgi:hypothetical protein
LGLNVFTVFTSVFQPFSALLFCPALLCPIIRFPAIRPIAQNDSYS